jgi:hypothetical protein
VGVGEERSARRAMRLCVSACPLQNVQMSHIAENEFRSALGRLLREALNGTAPEAAFFLNRGDKGLLASLEQLTAKQASARRKGGTSVAAHVDHLRYGLSLLNRWARGENPWSDADWTASWERVKVNDQQWKSLRQSLRAEAENWTKAIDERRHWDEGSVTEVTASVVHLAYHLGALRQIQPAMAGPRAKD